MRPSSPTPGCFSFMRKSKPKATTRAAGTAVPNMTETRTSTSTACKCTHAHAAPLVKPAPRASHEHYDACGCGDMGDLGSLLDLQRLQIKDAEGLPPYAAEPSVFSEDVRATIRTTIESYADKLTTLSLWISDHPELSFEERGAAKKLTAFLEDEGFDVERGYKDLETSFKASFSNGKGRTFGYNSEYDALPGVGHACGHNLIAVAGVAALLGLRAAMKKHGIKGTVVLIGTPAEEGGVGKGILLDRGGYKGIDGCMMIHPGGLPDGRGGLGAVTPTLAIQTINVQFHGRTAHAAGAPWDGINALDAAHIAYGSVAALRQQIMPTDRVHGIILHGGEAPNVIPDFTSMRFYVRGQTAKRVGDLMRKMQDIFDAAGKATGCRVEYQTERMMYDLKNNLQMAEEFASAMEDVHIPTHIALKDFSMPGGSTDFGNVTYALPACHPHYAIPAVPGRSNHTPEFRDKCREPEAHALTYKFAAGMCCVGARFLADKEFAEAARKWWEDDMKDA